MTAVQEVESSRNPDLISRLAIVQLRVDEIMAQEDPATALVGVQGIGKRMITGLKDIESRVGREEILAEMNAVLAGTDVGAHFEGAGFVFTTPNNDVLGRVTHTPDGERALSGKTSNGPSLFAKHVFNKVVVTAAARLATRHDIADKIRAEADVGRAHNAAFAQQRRLDREQATLKGAENLLNAYSVKAGEMFVVRRKVFHEENGYETKVEEALLALRDLGPEVFIAHAQYDRNAFGPGDVKVVGRIIDFDDRTAMRLHDALVTTGQRSPDEDLDEDDYEAGLRQRGWEV